MLTLAKVAVTGGLSCGKSSACHFFKEFGAYVVSADEIVHRLLSPNTNLGQKVIRLIGSEIVINHQIDRSQIAKKVFNQPELLQQLESLLHPAVRDEMEKLYQQFKEAKCESLFVAEIPLLYETGADRFFDVTIVVQADEKICQNRFKERTGHAQDEYEKRMSRQMNTTDKAKRADFVILNNGTLPDLRSAVEKIYKQLTLKTPK